MAKAVKNSRKMRHMTLPVLFRELAQMASQRSTYVTRGLVALALYAIGITMIYSILRVFSFSSLSSGNIQSVLGQGSGVLMGLHGIVTTGIFLILPAMVVSTITTERENGTLDLMLVTRLSPWEIVLQKLLARLIPLFTLLLLAMPFMGMAYGLGGVSTSDLRYVLAGWVMTSLTIASLSIMCSAVCKSTVGAFFASYGILFAGAMATPFFGIIGGGLGMLLFMPIAGPGMRRAIGISSLCPIIGAYAFGLVWVAIYLGIARAAIARPRRHGGGGAKDVFKRMDGALERTNARVGKLRWGRAASTTLPDRHPVAWRERAAAVVCVPRHLFRMLVCTNVPVAFILLMIVGFTWDNRYGRECGGFSVLMGLLWIPVTLAICIYVANLMTKERTNQTLDVLLTTPLDERHILTQKLAAVPRLCLVLMTPLILTMVVETICELRLEKVKLGQAFAYPVITLLFMGIYLYALTWVTFACSLKKRKRAHVVAMAVARVLAFVLVPILLAALIDSMRMRGLPHWLREEENMYMMSPAVLLGMLEFEKREFFDHIGAAIVNASFYLGLALLLRARSMRWARLHLTSG